MEPTLLPGEEARAYWLSRGLDPDALVGLDADTARGLVEAVGGHAQMITPDVHAVTADFSSLRIRLLVDAAGQVTRATAG